MQDNRLSIVIVNWNTRQLLERCLTTVKRTSCQLQPEIIAVDNNSTDGSQAMIQAQHPEVHLVCNSDNVGFARANNIGIRRAGGDCILLLNSDTEVRDNALHTLVTFMETHPTTGIVGPCLLNADGTYQRSYDLFPARPTKIVTHKIKEVFELIIGVHRGDQVPEWESTEPIEVDWVTGAALMIRRTTLEQIGLLDERFFMYAEEIDWCRRAKQAGWRVYYVPTAQVSHLKQGSSAVVPGLRQKLDRQREQSLELFYRKHYGALAAIGLHLIHRSQHLARANNR